MATRDGRGLRWHGYAGLAVILLAEVLLFAGNQTVGRWFTPIVWSGYLLFADALVYRLKGRSPLVTNRLELLVVALVSILSWWLFEFYNAPRFWRDELELWWHYHNLEPNPHLRRVGYDWAFATIFPALFLTAEALGLTVFAPAGARNVEPRTRPRLLARPLLYALVAVGTVGALVPFFVVNAWLVPLVWTALILVFDPLNALRGWPSLLGDLARGRWRRLASLCLSGVVCGVLWEFWNYWAVSRWTYTVPYLGHVKLFEMPVLGYLGYPPFALECWATYVFCRSLLGGRPVGARTRETDIIIDLQ